MGESKQRTFRYLMSSSSKIVGKKELLDWINQTLNLNYSKVEECANGAAFCQIMDSIFPGKVLMNRVDFSASLQHQVFENYKVLQDSFTKNGITKEIEVESLSRGKYMAVLEMLQWMFQFYAQTQPHPEYDAEARRLNKKASSSRISATKSKTELPKSPVVEPILPKSVSKPKPVSKPALKQKAIVPESPPKTAEHPKPMTQQSHISDGQTKSRIRELETELSSVSEKLDDMTLERDFYYNKLRSVEDFCQDYEENPLIKKIMKILYQTDESLGFVTPEEN